MEKKIKSMVKLIFEYLDKEHYLNIPFKDLNKRTQVHLRAPLEIIIKTILRSPIDPSRIHNNVEAFISKNI